MEIVELDVEAPWGKIAVKLWGNDNDPAVLSVHGIMDNAGTYDDLLPLLPRYFYICFDLPGHGKSSHFPSHLPIHSVNYLIVFKVLCEHFKREKYIIMGHSYGGQLALLFSQLYPERVEKLIMLDTVHLFTIQVKYFGRYLRDRLELFDKLEQKLKSNVPPAYSYQDAVDRLMQGRPSPLTERAAKNLLKRMLIPVGDDKYIFSFDQRLKHVFHPLHDNRYSVETFKEYPIQCPVLMVFGLQSHYQRHILRPILNYLKGQKNVAVKYVEGHHDVHQNDPELVAPYVSEFLQKAKSKL